ncbi:hypothetical protein ECANGB1_373 [Enterospora canceri]|uniref:Uncharacterized protein n=1 Tax=Enterospora canceri TaxID=1081671 RepID=A0A1Y1S541_9MICR|nr:hypothetical protein ECANGB1_373 [Enterospora canceri]
MEEDYEPTELNEETNLVTKIIYSKRTPYSSDTTGRNVLDNLQNPFVGEYLHKQIKRRKEVIEALEEKLAKILRL